MASQVQFQLRLLFKLLVARLTTVLSRRKVTTQVIRKVGGASEIHSRCAKVTFNHVVQGSGHIRRRRRRRWRRQGRLQRRCAIITVMNKQMLLQLVLPGKCFGTDGALELLQARVRQCMSLQMIMTLERLVAFRALVRSRIIVLSEVLLQQPMLDETFVAQRALESAVYCATMYIDDMQPQALLTVELCVTELTRHLTCVRCQVHVETHLQRVLFSTDATLVLRLGVQQHVTLEHTLARQAAAADGTVEPRFRRVQLHVLLEVRLTEQHELTDFALARTLLVSLHVLH